MRTLVLINEKAGSFRECRHSVTEMRLRQYFLQLGVDAEVKILRGNCIRTEAEAGVRAGLDAVVAGGGDGTVNTVASCLVGTKVALGVLPLGTFNHFAKDLRIPLDFEAALENIARGRHHTIDVGEVNNHIFINNSSIGLYPHIVRRREGLRAKLGIDKFRAMVYAAATIFKRFPIFQIRVDIDGHETRLKTPFVFVGNNEYAMDFFNLGTRSRLDQGQLCLYTTNCTGRTCLLRLAIRLLFNSLEQAKDFDSRLVEELLLDTKRKKLRVSLDGEVVRMKPPLRYRIRRAALQVLVPEDLYEGNSTHI